MQIRQWRKTIPEKLQRIWPVDHHGEGSLFISDLYFLNLSIPQTRNNTICTTHRNTLHLEAVSYSSTSMNPVKATQQNRPILNQKSRFPGNRQKTVLIFRIIFIPWCLAGALHNRGSSHLCMSKVSHGPAHVRCWSQNAAEAPPSGRTSPSKMHSHSG
jgi:hypothetical protein